MLSLQILPLFMFFLVCSFVGKYVNFPKGKETFVMEIHVIWVEVILRIIIESWKMVIEDNIGSVLLLEINLIMVLVEITSTFPSTSREPHLSPAPWH